ncbi:unnamed protein product [Orchesella dallaii]|uniref:Uncharacterized protein n=1 Tax=Orchesella dallaii TaxID=48710 RepID=A0ABP1S6M7_9HEXA
MLSSRSQSGILELTNLIAGNHNHDTQSPYKIVRSKKNVWVVGGVLLILFFCTAGAFTSSIVNLVRQGLANAIKSTWYAAIKDLAQDDLNELHWWKKVISFIIILTQIDQQMIIGSALALLILMAKTLESICVHFTNSVRDNRDNEGFRIIVPGTEVSSENCANNFLHVKFTIC